MNKSNDSICFLNSHPTWGGGEKWHLETSEYLHKKGKNVFVCAYSKGALIERLSKSIQVEGVCSSNLNFFNPFAYIQAYKILKKHSVKTIILCLPIDVKVAGVVAKFLGIKNIIYRRGSAIPIKDSLYNRFLFSKVLTHIIANSEATKNTILEKNQKLFPREKITVLYNGIEIPQIEKSQIIDGNKPFIIGAAGRLEQQKNFFSLIEIAKILKQKNLNFKILIAGKGSLHDALQQEIIANQLEKFVELVGFQSDMQKFYSQLDVFALTSLWEGFGFVLAEAMTHYLPLVAYNVSSNVELIMHEKNGFLVELNNNQQFAEYLELLITQPIICKEMGLHARKFVEQQFDSNITMQKVELFLDTL